ncbi:MAG: lipopolysaccharide biosynthesis protein [Ktedonobacteraceae bacterium]
MKTVLYRWVKANSIILVNAGSLVGTTAVTSVLGFVYWWLAAREFPPEVIGIASASISAMMLLGNFCMLGLGTLLITELPRQPGRAASLISTALIVVGGVGGCISITFAFVAPYVSADFQVLRASVADIVIFASGVSLTAITLVLDLALIGLLQGGLQLWRNTLFAVAKLAALLVAGLWLSHKAGITIYTTWVVGNVLSLAALAAFVVFKKGGSRRNYLPQWRLLRKLGPAALQHHLLNLTLQAPTLVLPVLVTALLSATMNAWFYVSWMIASFVFVVPGALTAVLHAINSAQQSMLAHKARATISLALVTSVLANCVLQFDTQQVLSLFGHTYAEQATWTLRILALGAFPLIIKNHYISICRIQDRIARAMLSMAPGSLLELCAAVLGARLGGLSGLSLGWIIAISIESIFMFRTVYQAIRFTGPSSPVPSGEEYVRTEAIWLIETSRLPAIGYAGIEPIWLLETSVLSGIKQGHQEPGGYLLQEESNRHKNRGRLRLKPPQLQRYTLYDDDMPITDKYVNSQFLDKRQADNTAVEDKVM